MLFSDMKGNVKRISSDTLKGLCLERGKRENGVLVLKDCCFSLEVLRSV